MSTISDSAHWSKRVYELPGLRVDVGRRRVRVNEQLVPLTRKEFDLLVALCDAHGRVVRDEDLLQTVWGFRASAEMNTRTHDVHISSLRRKLGDARRHIRTVMYMGYQLDEPAKEVCDETQ